MDQAREDMYQSREKTRLVIEQYSTGSAMSRASVNTACHKSSKKEVPDADVARELSIRALLHAQVDQRILPKHALGVQIGSQEAAVACERQNSSTTCTKASPNCCLIKGIVPQPRWLHRLTR